MRSLRGLPTSHSRARVDPVMKLSIATTATGIVVKDLATGQQLTWVDEVSIAYSSCVGRTVTYLAT